MQLNTSICIRKDNIRWEFRNTNLISFFILETITCARKFHYIYSVVDMTIDFVLSSQYSLSLLYKSRHKNLLHWEARSYSGREGLLLRCKVDRSTHFGTLGFWTNKI